MMSNSNYSIGLQRLKSVHTAYCGLHNLAENWSWARDVNGRDRDKTETSASRDPDVDNFSRDETETSVNTYRDRLETETSRPRPQSCIVVGPPRFFLCGRISCAHTHCAHCTVSMGNPALHAFPAS